MLRNAVSSFAAEGVLSSAGSVAVSTAELFTVVALLWIGGAAVLSPVTQLRAASIASDDGTPSIASLRMIPLCAVRTAFGFKCAGAANCAPTVTYAQRAAHGRRDA